ncbi:helicase-related protein [Clostridium polynesiense]|uniref:helicase-related protein n=1 Tax=Clostridium polynesiense TaxID=1325933 RepID=UPI00058CB69A|nr:helicase-related protein [Clostridium polynesiense]
MKRGAAERNFRKLKNQIAQIDEIIRNSKTSSLWEHEAAIRKKLKSLGEMKNQEIKDFNRVYTRYLEMLEYVSRRLIQDYNMKNNTDFSYDEVVNSSFDGYLRSGIISVLISNHIPEIVAKDFKRVFPSNPKDEYLQTRNIPRKVYLHLGETNTGKTYNAMEALKKSSKGVYLSPLRILALENYEKLNNEGVKCSLITGEEQIIVEGAVHLSCTIEKLDLGEYYETAVIDEIQMIKDDQRGAAWTRALLGVKSREIHICGALNSKEILIDILEDCGEEYEIKEYKRNIPLLIEDKAFNYKDIQPGDALVAFSKKRVLELAAFYSNLGIKAAMIYGDLPPEVRRSQYEDFINKRSSILVTTDAVGMGVNLPIRRIIFMDVKKYDGTEIRFLNSQEVKQIAGRAGRKGIYDEGYVAAYGNNVEFIRENINIADDPIREAVLGPGEAILDIKGLFLREKLALWSTMEESIYFYRKMDISEYLVVLDKLKPYKLPEKIQWKLIKVPFDVSKDDIMKAFLGYIDEIFIGKSDEISKPNCYIRDLYNLEIYYQKINLYYSLSNSFKLTFDEEWVYSERSRVSEEIIEILRKI